MGGTIARRRRDVKPGFLLEKLTAARNFCVKPPVFPVSGLFDKDQRQ